MAFQINFQLMQSEPENLKKSRPKKTREIKQINFTNIFCPNFISCTFKNDQNSIFELGKSLKLPKMQFHEKIFGFI